MKHFAKEVASRTEQIVHEHNIPAVHLVMPADVEHLVSEHLEPKVKSHVAKVIHRDLVDASVTETVKRIVDLLGLAS
jgi:protein required for attachment to host cells